MKMDGGGRKRKREGERETEGCGRKIVWGKDLD